MIHGLIGSVPFMATILLSTIALSLSIDAQAQLEHVTLGYPVNLNFLREVQQELKLR